MPSLPLCEYGLIAGRTRAWRGYWRIKGTRRALRRGMARLPFRLGHRPSLEDVEVADHGVAGQRIPIPPNFKPNSLRDYLTSTRSATVIFLLFTACRTTNLPA